MFTTSSFSARARTHWLTVVLALLLFIPLLFNAAPAQAQNFSVGTTAELVTAIGTANTNGQDDVITLAVTTYNIGSTLVIGADGGHSLTIYAQQATINANNSGRAIEIASGANVTIDKLPLTGGNADIGGGILNNGTLTLIGTVPFSNSATAGGAIYNNGTLTLNASVFLTNTAAMGGAVYNSSTGNIIMTGGAIRANNRATGTSGGAGIYNDGGTITMINGNITGNSATAGPGGAIAGDSGTLLIRNSTIADNSATQYGGISFDGTLTIQNSIVANNSSGDCSSSGTATVQYSLIESGGCGITNGVNGNLTGDPNLGTFAPEYYPLNAGSIAINAGTNALATGIEKDAAGQTRIQGDVVDMGSYETNTAPPTLSINDVTLSEGNSGTKTFSFTVSVSPRASTGGITFDIATADGTATVSNNDYAARSLTGQTIAERGTTFTFDVTVNGDTTYETNESFFVNITNVVGATVTDGQGIGTINNDDPAPTTTTASTAPDPSVFGQTVTLAATVTSSAGTPTGTVAFFDGGTFLGNATLNSGTANLDISTLAAASHSLTAVYVGNASFAASTSSLETHTVNQANSSTSVTSAPDPSVFGQAVTLTATVAAVTPGAGTPTGTVEFYDGSTLLGTGTLDGLGAATFTTSSLTVGTHDIKATYLGDSNFNGSTSPIDSTTVNQASTTTSVSADPVTSVFGQNVTFTATVAITTPGAGTLTGSVQFFANGTTFLGEVSLISSSSTATLNTSGLPAGTSPVTAVYVGNTNFEASTSLAQNVTVNYANTQTTLSSSPNPAAFGQSMTFTAVVSASSPSTGTPSDWVYFLDGVTEIGSSTLSGGTATFSTSALTAGTHTITARYGGVGGYNPSISSPVTQTVNYVATTTTVSSAPNPSTYAQSVTLTATVTTAVSGAGDFSGAVEFIDGTTSLGTATLSAGGVATLTTSSLTGGNHPITAVYSGGGNYAGSTATAHTHTVSAAATTTTITGNTPNPSVFGQAVVISASITSSSGTPTGTVEFFDGTTSLGTATLVGGTATITTDTLSVGIHNNITARYLGDGNFAISTSAAVSQVVNQASTTTTLSGTPNPSVVGQAVTFTATIAVVAPGAGTPTGTVEFFDGATSLGTGTLSGGTASLTTGALGVGTHSITATYSGDVSFTGSTSTITSHTVNQASTTTTLSSAPNPSVFGQAVTFTASVAAAAPGAGTPTGTVEFLDGATLLGTATLAGGTAEFTISALSVGAHTITATYSGDSNYVTSTTTASHVVDQAGTTVSVTSAPNPSSFGEAVTITASVTAAAPGDGTATGTVDFFDGSTSLGTATLSGGTASFTTSTLGLGAHTITAVYSGDGSFTGNTSPNITQTVGAAATGTTLASSPNPSYVGDVVTLTATVTASSGTATGTVEFFDGSTSLGTAALVGDTATMTINTLSVGSHSLTAVYSGCPEATASTSEALSHTVELIPAGTTLASSPNPSYFGDVVTLTATVNVGGGTPTGTVEFFDGSTTLGTATLVGDTATMTTSTLAEGTHSLTAVYSGDETYAAGTSPALTHIIKPVPIITVDPVALADGTAEIAYSQVIRASGGSGSYSFAVTGGALPAGLALTATGALTGTPIYAGTASFTVTATDTATTFTGERAYTLVIHSAPPPPPPAPYAEDINFDTEAPVRTGVPETLVDSISLRVLYQNGQPVQWLGGDLYNAGSIGVQGILDLGVQQAVDIFSPNGVNYFNGGAVFCLRGTGPLIWLAASGVPRHAEIIGSYTVPEFPGYTCATLFEPGTLVLVRDLPR